MSSRESSQPQWWQKHLRESAETVAMSPNAVLLHPDTHNNPVAQRIIQKWGFRDPLRDSLGTQLLHDVDPHDHRRKDTVMMAGPNMIMVVAPDEQSLRRHLTIAYENILNEGGNTSVIYMIQNGEYIPAPEISLEDLLSTEK